MTSTAGRSAEIAGASPRWWRDDFPERPGVYLFRGAAGPGAAAGKVLYVGKARDLRARLTTYRRPGGDGRLGLQFLERDAAAVETIVTRTEQEALLLEDSLIKAHKPPHNVRLKDDKSFLMVRVDLDERFPRLKLVREHSPRFHGGVERGVERSKGRSRTFGPYASARSVRRLLADIHQVVPLRDCADAVMNHRTRPCLKHQIGLCAAPCVGRIDERAYAEQVERAMRVLSGEIGELAGELESRMQAAAAEMAYERAAEWRDRLDALRRAVERQGVKSRERVERDVLGLARAGDRAVVHRLAFRDGRLSESRAHAFESELADDELLHGVLTALYGPGRHPAPAEIVLPAEPADAALLGAVLGAAVALVVPGTGERRRMLDLAAENAREALERAVAAAGADAQAAEALARLTGLGERGAGGELVVDCFDVSNFQGSSSVASRVRFRGGAPDRAGYRRYRVKTVEGQDDFASMREVVARSLRRGLADGDLPDLVVIDGGAQQLESALAARDEVGAWDVRIVALAKARSERSVRGRRRAESEERVYLTPKSPPIELARHTAVRHALERLRDEAHRVAITYHRKIRGRIRSQLDGVPGVGPAKRKALIRAFGSVQGVKAASVEQIAAVPGIGMDLARTIVEKLRSGAG